MNSRRAWLRLSMKIGRTGPTNGVSVISDFGGLRPRILLNRSSIILRSGTSIWNWRVRFLIVSSMPGWKPRSGQPLTGLKLRRFAGGSYLFTRVVKSEALYRPLLESGFAQVEERRLYRTRIGDLLQGESSQPDSGPYFTSLAEAPRERYDSLRAQIFEICGEAFGKRGFSRHFTDSFLFERLPGHAYIKAAMELNFQRQQAASFLVAVDRSWDLLYGFSVLGRKHGLNCDIYTQLLSAVRTGHRDRNIYQGITRFLADRLPPDAILLNATHADNLPMQAAYQRSGRRHLADTVVMRRVFDFRHAVTV